MKEEIGAGFDETGRLIRDEAGFLLQRDLGGTLRLVLLRVPVDHVEKRVRVQDIMQATVWWKWKASPLPEIAKAAAIDVRRATGRPVQRA